MCFGHFLLRICRNQWRRHGAGWTGAVPPTVSKLDFEIVANELRNFLTAGGWGLHITRWFCRHTCMLLMLCPQPLTPGDAIGRNGHLNASSHISDTTIRFSDPAFLRLKILMRFENIFGWYFSLGNLKIHRISISGWFHPISQKACYEFRSMSSNLHQVWSWCSHPLPSYTFSLLIYYITLWSWHLTVSLKHWSYIAGQAINPSINLSSDYLFLSYKLLRSQLASFDNFCSQK